MLIRKEHMWVLRNVKAITGEFQHTLEGADIDKKRMRNVMRKTRIDGRKLSLLNDRSGNNLK